VLLLMYSTHSDSLAVRLLVFASGPCNFGAGATATIPPSEHTTPTKSAVSVGMTTVQVLVHDLHRELELDSAPLLNQTVVQPLPHSPSSPTLSHSNEEEEKKKTNEEQKRDEIAHMISSAILPQTEFYRDWVTPSSLPLSSLSLSQCHSLVSYTYRARDDLKRVGVCVCVGCTCCRSWHHHRFVHIYNVH
jgi:hypothetical protein